MALAQDQIRFISAVLISIPLSFVLRKLQTKQLRLLYSFLLGTLLQFYVYGTDIWMSFSVHLAIYTIIKINGRKSGKLVTTISIISLSAYHIYRLIIDYGNWTLDISTILMPMVCKYSLFAYAYEDGGQPNENLNPIQQKQKI